ncbi:MAG: SH3 domain-containing protein [Pseudomonadota bacterium]
MGSLGRRALAVAILCSLTGAAVADGVRGPVTGLPLPRFVSLKASEANMRRGPSRSHRIDWILRHRGMPLEVIAEFDNWRRVRDRDGAAGWVHYSLLSGARSVVVTGGRVALRTAPELTAETVALAEEGVIASLGDCNAAWCEVSADGYSGWVQRAVLWGADN